MSPLPAKSLRPRWRGLKGLKSMRYDFTSHMERHGKDSIAVDGLGTGFAPEPPEEGFDVIPMWVADMNFPTVPR